MLEISLQLVIIQSDQKWSFDMKWFSIFFLSCLLCCVFQESFCLEKTFDELKLEHAQMVKYIGELQDKVLTLSLDKAELQESYDALIDFVVSQKLKESRK